MSKYLVFFKNKYSNHDGSILGRGLGFRYISV